jgi:nitrite reductase/ring-hydroxylating ferredoxin subunit
MRFAIGKEALVLFRGRETGVVHALPRHCQHQGVDLARGTVVGDRLRCPLHYWEYSNRCERIPGGATPPPATVRHHVTERFGMIFVHLGEAPSHPLRSFSADDDSLYFRAGKPVEIGCPWWVPLVNAFDLTHLRTVHRRALTSGIDVSYPDRRTFRVRYSTAVTGNGWSDRAMRLLSGNDIRVDIACFGGTILAVESSVREWRSYLLVSLRPTETGVSILPLFGVPRRKSGLHRLHARLSAALFTAFLKRDVDPLSGIRFPPDFHDDGDETVNACYQYLCRTPQYDLEEAS